MIVPLLFLLAGAPLPAEENAPPAPLDEAAPEPTAPGAPAPPSTAPDRAAPSRPAPDPRPTDDDDGRDLGGYLGAPIGGSAGCAGCGIVPFVVGSAAAAFMIFAVATGFSEGGCAGALLVIVGVAVGLSFGGFSALVLGPLAAIGALLGAGVGAWLAGRNPLAPLLGALAGVAVGLIASLATVSLFALTDENIRASLGISDTLLFPVLTTGLVGALAAGALAGPVAIVSAVATDVALGAPLEITAYDDVRLEEEEDLRPRRRRRSAMAF